MKPPMKKAGPATKARKSPAKTPPALAMPGASHTGDEMKYKAQDALHTLRRADEIKRDGELMKHVHQHAANERDHLNRILRRKKPA